MQCLYFRQYWETRVRWVAMHANSTAGLIWQVAVVLFITDALAWQVHVFPLTNIFSFSHNQQSCILQVFVHHFATWPCMANSIIFANMTYIQWKNIHIYLSSPRFGSLSSSVINDEAPLDPTGLKSILARSLERWNKKYVYLQPYCAFPKCI